MKLKWSVHKDSDYCLCVPNFLSDEEGQDKKDMRKAFRLGVEIMEQK